MYNLLVIQVLLSQVGFFAFAIVFSTETGKPEEMFPKSFSFYLAFPSSKEHTENICKDEAKLGRRLEEPSSDARRPIRFVPASLGR